MGCRTNQNDSIATEADEYHHRGALIPSAKNQQILRFKPINGELAREYVKNVKLGALLPELSLPMQGTEPNAFIIICTKSEINNWSYIDIGISAQTMLLKAVTMGLNGICIGAFNLEKTKQLLPEGYKPLLVLAIGKSVEKIELVPVNEGDSLAYYREDGKHFVPKIENLIID